MTTKTKKKKTWESKREFKKKYGLDKQRFDLWLTIIAQENPWNWNKWITEWLKLFKSRNNDEEEMRPDMME